jgi:hypothetical protein
MPTPPVTKAFATKLIAAVNRSLSEGHRPPETAGHGPGALSKAAEIVGRARSYVTPTLLRRIKLLHGIEPDWSLWKEPQTSETQPLAIPVQPTFADRVLPLLKRGAFTVETIAVQLKTTRGRIIDAIDELKSRGVSLIETNGAWTATATAAPAFVAGASHEYLSTKDNRYRFGVVADSHLGSKYERLDALNDIYDRFSREGITRVYHAGNWIEGEAYFNRTEIHTHGMDAQLRYLAKHYPQRPGIVTYAVTGNDHEGWYAKREGIDIGNRAETIMRDAGRTDWVNMGFMEAHITLRNANSGKTATAALVHPGGGSAYADSYVVQKILESLDGGEKPAFAMYGHYHKALAGEYRNVFWVLVPSTKDQDTFMRGKRIRSVVGGGIVELEQDPNTGGLVGMTPTIWRYFNKGYYDNRWSHSGDVTLPDRGPGGP